MRSSLILCLSALLVLPAVLHADNPTSANLRLRVTGSETARRLNTNIRVRAKHIFAEPLAEGTICAVNLAACVQRFVPLRVRPNRTAGTCNGVPIASATLTAGQQAAIFRTAGPPLIVKRAGRARQVSFQTESVCIDGSDNEATIYSPPRARKSSRKDRVGRTPARVLAVYVKRARVAVQ